MVTVNRVFDPANLRVFVPVLELATLVVRGLGGNVGVIGLGLTGDEGRT
jgi:hypothetical protein